MTTAADFATIDTIPGDQRSYDAGNLKPSKSYQFIIIAKNAIGEGQTGDATPAIKIPAEGKCFTEQKLFEALKIDQRQTVLKLWELTLF